MLPIGLIRGLLEGIGLAVALTILLPPEIWFTAKTFVAWLAILIGFTLSEFIGRVFEQ